jgi:fucose permease
MAGIYPTTVSFSGSIIAKYPMAWSFILTIASFGSIIMPSIIGTIAEKAGIAVGMSSVTLVVAVDMVFILVLCAYSRKIRGSAEQV